MRVRVHGHKKLLQSNARAVHRNIARHTRECTVQRKCLTRSDGSGLIVRYFFITWESAAPLNRFELVNSVVQHTDFWKFDARRACSAQTSVGHEIKVSVSSPTIELLYKSGGTVAKEGSPRRGPSTMTVPFRATATRTARR